jgi:outer membrane protein
LNKVIQTIAFTAAASGMLLTGSALAAGEKIGVVNFQEVMQKIPQSAAVMQNLETEFKDDKAELMKLEGDIKFEQEKLKRDGALMSEAQKKESELKITTMYQDYQTKGKVFQQKSGQRQNEETNKIIALVRQAVDNIAAKSKYDLIVEQKAVVFSKPDADITEQVVEQVSKLK